MTNKMRCLLIILLLLVATASCFEREGTAKDLAGSTWRVEDINQQAVVDPAITTIEFPEPGRVSGSTGCNRYSGTIWFNGERYGVKGIAVTERACRSAVMDQEKKFLKALNDGKRMVVEGSYLRFYGADEKIVLRLVRVRP